MRIVLPMLAIALLTGCRGDKTYDSICDMGEAFRGWGGINVRMPAMITRGGMEVPPLIVDRRCWRGIRADFRLPFPQLEKAIASPGRFNINAIITGKITDGDGRDAWLRVVKVERLEVLAPETQAGRDAFFRKMIRERNVYYQSR
jgi:hypothetical protein